MFKDALLALLVGQIDNPGKPFVDTKAIICPPNMMHLNGYFGSLKSMKSPPKYQIMINDNNLMNTGVEKPSDLSGTIDFIELINSGDLNSSALNDVKIDFALELS